MIISGLIGVSMIILGIVLISGQYLLSQAEYNIRQNLLLIDGSEGYKAWLSPLTLRFSCYLFNVTNPDGVMRGENPNFVEYGPISYTEVIEKEIIDVEEKTDEIIYKVKSMYSFDKYKSINGSNTEKVTVLNPAYVGTISTLASLPPNFMEQYGDSIALLSPNTSTIFLKARATDILFNGVKVKCNTKKYPDLQLICKTLDGKPPPVLAKTNEEGTYLLSIFQRLNDTYRGPFSIKRGLKDISELGDITSYKGKKLQAIWKEDKCNKVRGTDTITWPPLIKPTPFVSTFIPDYCRSIDADYDYNLTIHGILGSRYSMKERVWFLNDSQCYCPLINKKPACLPQGLLDATDCQGVPVIVSEPHFLHADPELLSYARGLKPDPEIHSTYVVIEPNTGTPLSGVKKSQINLKLSRHPVKLLSNVSEGYFPLMWCEDGNALTKFSVIAYTYQLFRLINVCWFLQYVPLIVGIYIILMTLFLRGRRKVQPVNSVVNSILISSNIEETSLTRRNLRRPLYMFSETSMRVYDR